ncbi:MAG: ABC transporter permease, partial [Actinomycetales bacterium]
VAYLTFLAPALIASAAISAAIDETMFPTLEGFKWRKTFYGANSAPLTGNQIASGVFIAAMARVFFSVTLYWLVLIAFDVLTINSWPVILVAALGGAAFGAALMGFVGKVHNDDLFMSAFSRMVVTPLFLFSGTFFPLTSMPIYFQPIGWISPLWHSAELGRHFAYGHEVSPSMILIHFIFLISVFILGIRFSGRQFTRRLLK